MTDLPEDYCFPSKRIHPAHENIQQNWNHLLRGYVDENVFKTFIEIVLEYTMVTYDGLVSLCDLVRFCEQKSIEGDYFDVGSWKGGCTGLMMLTNIRYGATRRHIHVFDSFQGMPEPIAGYDTRLPRDWTPLLGENDWGGKLRPTNILDDAEVRHVQSLVEMAGYPEDMVHIHEGWFQETIPAVAPAIDRIAILRLDGDYYDSTRVAMEHLFPLVVSGGFVILDDYSWEGVRRACDEYFDKHGLTYYPVRVDSTVHIFIKQ